METAADGDRPWDISGMSAAEAREYLFHHVTTLKLTEKEIQELDGERARWQDQAELARSKGAADLAAEAERRAEAIRVKRSVLEEENAGLRETIRRIQARIPALAAGERSVDPDLLEQELLIAAGYNPGDEKAAEAGRRLGELKKEADAEEALRALKAKMKEVP
ncbi:MAG: chromosome partitioning protein [Treponema sp.]|jgi:phage shock protein A|nr:chromosome partitioning protein [Treponema sp.]